MLGTPKGLLALWAVDVFLRSHFHTFSDLNVADVLRGLTLYAVAPTAQMQICHNYQ